MKYITYIQSVPGELRLPNIEISCHTSMRVAKEGCREMELGGMLQILSPPSLNYQALLIHSARLLGEVQCYKVTQGMSARFFETIFKEWQWPEQVSLAHLTPLWTQFLPLHVLHYTWHGAGIVPCTQGMSMYFRAEKSGSEQSYNRLERYENLKRSKNLKPSKRMLAEEARLFYDSCI